MAGAVSKVDYWIPELRGWIININEYAAITSTISLPLSLQLNRRPFGDTRFNLAGYSLQYVRHMFVILRRRFQHRNKSARRSIPVKLFSGICGKLIGNDHM